MKLSLIILIPCLFLDVILFPFSCQSQKRDYVIYVYDLVIDDKTYFERNSEKINESNTIEKPKDSTLEIEGYEIEGWYLLNSNYEIGFEAINFPYQIQESDYLTYFEGYRHSVVLKAKWVLKNAN